MQFHRRLLNVLFKLEISLCILAYVMIAGLLLGDVIMREAGGGSIWGAQRVSVYLMIVVGFMGLGLAASTGRHLRPQVFDRMIVGQLSSIADRIGSVLMMIIFGYAALVSLDYLQDAIDYNETARVIQIPMWYIQVVIPYAFFSTATRYAIFAYDPTSRPEEALE